MTETNLIPLPVRMTRGAGAAASATVCLEPRYTGARTPRLERAVARLERARQPAAEPAPVMPLIIHCADASAPFPALDDDESYLLEVDPTEIRVAAPGEWGVLHALTTLTQLLSVSTLVPLHIEDAPRFRWRGLMLDVARHFIDQQALLRTLDAMAAFKLNVLHLHLSDDQGFRFPSDRFPDLASAEHYSRAELEALVAQAADRGIRVVPELDVPGHSTCWLAAYPEWGSRPAQPTDRFGVHEACLDPTRPAVRAALAALLGELAEVFPDAFVHVGGDEVHPAWWAEDEGIQAYLREHGLADVAALQAQLNGFLADTLTGLGRRMLAWDEALHPELPAHVAVQAWRGATARDRALAAGHPCVMSAPYYLDLGYPADVHYTFDPAAPQAELLALEDAMLSDPRLAHVAGGMAWTHQWREGAVSLGSGEGGDLLLGAEACLWAELVDARLLDVRLWSRMPALAERFWSPAPGAAAADVRRRMWWAWTCLSSWANVDLPGDVRRRTREAGVREAWWPLVEMLEPVKWYGRLLGEEALAARLRGREMPRARPYGTQTPLDRVVDALPPESAAAVELDAWLRAEAAGDRLARERVRALAARWRDLPADAGPAELAGPAARLSALGELVIAVLEGAISLEEARRRLLRAAPPQGEYLLAPVPVLMRWVEAGIGEGAYED